MDNINTIKKDNDSKKIFTMLILILTLMVCTTGATYAYFAIGATATNNMTGTAATASLIITNSSTGTAAAAPSLIAPSNVTYTSLPIVPQISYTGSTNVLQKALTGASGKDKCVDANGNVICRAYTFYVRNLSSAAADIRGSIKFSYATNAFHNLRWKLMDSATTVTVSSGTVSSAFSTTAPINASNGTKIYFDTSNVALAKEGGTKQYWIIVWIEETGADQGSSAGTSLQDVGTWYATIQFEAFNEAGSAIGGITSTITS